MPDYPRRMYHPDLEPPDNETDAMDENQAAVYADAGWLDVPEPEQREGYAPEPVKYEPVKTEPSKTAAKKSAAKKSEPTD